MKIDNAYKATTAVVTPRTPSAASAKAGGSQEAVSLSALAGSLQGNEQPPVNTARIEEIKKAISEGRFQINVSAIADRLIESARDLVNNNGKREA